MNAMTRLDRAERRVREQRAAFHAHDPRQCESCDFAKNSPWIRCREWQQLERELTIAEARSAEAYHLERVALRQAASPAAPTARDRIEYLGEPFSAGTDASEAALNPQARRG